MERPVFSTKIRYLPPPRNGRELIIRKSTYKPYCKPLFKVLQQNRNSTTQHHTVWLKIYIKITGAGGIRPIMRDLCNINMGICIWCYFFSRLRINNNILYYIQSNKNRNQQIDLLMANWLRQKWLTPLLSDFSRRCSVYKNSMYQQLLSPSETGSIMGKKQYTNFPRR